MCYNAIRIDTVSIMDNLSVNFVIVYHIKTRLWRSALGAGVFSSGNILARRNEENQNAGSSMQNQGMRKARKKNI